MVEGMAIENLTQILLFAAEAILVAVFVLFLFRVRHRVGLSPLYLALGTFQYLNVVLALSAYVEILPGLVVSPGSAVLFTATLFAFLLVYIHEDAAEARLLLIGLAIANIILVLFSRLFSLHLDSVLGRAFLDVPRELFAQDLRVMVVGTATLLLDGVLLAALYELLCRVFPRWSLLRAYLSLSLVLVFDSLVFVTGCFLGRPDYVQILGAGIAGKLFAAFFFALALSVAQSMYRRWLPEPSTDEVSREEVFSLLTYRQRYRRLRETEDQLNQAAERLDIALEAGAVGTWDWYPEEARLAWDDRMCGIFGVSPFQFTGAGDEFFRRVHPDDLDRVVAEAFKNPDREVVDVRYRIVTDEGQLRYIQDRARRYRDAQGELTRMVGMCIDVTAQEEAKLRLSALTRELRVANEELEEMSVRDPMTGVRNRRGLARVLDRDLARSQRSGAPIAAILIDCDDFKAINDSYGHAVGDAALIAIAEAVRGNIRRGDTLGRIGGDEFLVLLVDTGVQAAQRVAEKLRRAVSSSAPHALGGEQLTVSLAVAELDEETQTLKEVILRTQKALKASKVQGKNRVSVEFASSVGSASSELRNGARTLDVGCVLDGHYSFAYPIYSLRDDTPTGYELVLRGPSGPGELPEAIFAAAAAEDRLELLDAEVLNMHLDAANEASLKGRLHLNVMASTLRRLPEELIVRLRERAASSGLCLEVAAQHLSMDLDENPFDPQRLRELGSLLAIDGAVLRSLGAIAAFGPDLVKVDRCAFVGIDRLHETRETLARFVEMVRGLGAQVAAVGVESSDERDALCDLGFDLAQGPLWSESSLTLGVAEPIETSGA